MVSITVQRNALGWLVECVALPASLMLMLELGVILPVSVSLM